MTPAQASRFLAQATFGATAQSIEDVQRQGPAAWIDEQLRMPPSPSHYDWLMAHGAGTEANKGNGINALLDASLWRKFIDAPDQLRMRAGFALSEIFVVNVASLTFSWPLLGAASFMDTLTAHAFDTYRALLEAVARHIAMGSMLTYRGNRREDARTGRHPDENFARESMQLFSIGLTMLNPDGTQQLRDGHPIDTYNNDDVQGLAKVFTGWDLNGAETDPSFVQRPMALTPAEHSTSEKRFLGTAIAAGTDANLSMKQALDTLANHPNVGPFIGRQLIQRLVCSNPSPAYIGRVSAVFADDGKGVRGNLGAVLRAILLDPEARQADARDPAWGKIREPILRFSGWARAFGARSSNGAWSLPDTSDSTVRLGQSPMRAPSVFNFFRPHYAPPASPIAAAGLVAPELQITDETSVAGYLNFVGIYVDRGWEDVQTDYAAEVKLAGDPAALLAHIALLLAGDGIGQATLDSIAQAVATIPAERPRDRVRAAITLVVATPEYLVQK